MRIVRTRMVSAWWELAGGRLHSLVAEPAREGVPVVLVHGMVIASRYMIPTAERLAESFPIWVPDLPGYGKSYKPWPILSVAGLADALAEFVETARLGRAHWVG